MRSIALVTISLVAVIALLDVAAAFVVNGTVDVPPLLILVVAVAVVVQLVNLIVGAMMATDPRDIATLLRLWRHAEALARHTAVLRARYPFAEATRYHQVDLGSPSNKSLS